MIGTIEQYPGSVAARRAVFGPLLRANPAVPGLALSPLPSLRSVHTLSNISIRCLLMLCRIGEHMPLTENLAMGFSPAGVAGVGSHCGGKLSFVDTCDLRQKGAGIKRQFGWHTFRHTYSTLLRSVGTEFKVMQELLRHSTLRSTLDIYAQAITPAKRAAQAAVLSLVFPETQGGNTAAIGINQP